jgi:glyoxylase-like metal-dependent hydrolase (beta-lactamase superfamily II)
MKINDKLFAYPWRDYRANNGNSFVVRTEETSCLIDPGHEAFLPQLFESMKEDGVDPEDLKTVILTHGHPDHMEGGLTLRKQGARVGIHKEEEAYIQEMGPYLARMLGIQMPEVRFDFFLQEGELTIGEERFQVIHTPGHSPGSVCLFWEEPKVLFSGDLIFPQGVGRTDFPGGDGNLLKQSIRRCRTLGAAMLMPGHGEPILEAEMVEKNFEMIEMMYFDYV